MAGRKINDHSSWVGAASKGSVFPDGPHKVKVDSSADGVGALSRYEDTSEAIKSQQMAGNAKVRGHAAKPGYRY